jgi:hypothetical protein
VHSGCTRTVAPLRPPASGRRAGSGSVATAIGAEYGASRAAPRCVDRLLAVMAARDNGFDRR